MKNVILIGMPGSGKSTVGVLLAKTLCRPFIDVDLQIQQYMHMPLLQIIEREGVEAFLSLEENVVLGIQAHNHVIATGGSVVYREPSMMHLKGFGVLVYLTVSLTEIERRIRSITTRGVAMQPDQTLQELFAERRPLYERYADLVVDCEGKDPEAVIEEVCRVVKPYLPEGAV